MKREKWKKLRNAKEMEKGNEKLLVHVLSRIFHALMASFPTCSLESCLPLCPPVVNFPPGLDKQCVHFPHFTCPVWRHLPPQSSHHDLHPPKSALSKGSPYFHCQKRKVFGFLASKKQTVRAFFFWKYHFDSGFYGIFTAVLGRAWVEKSFVGCPENLTIVCDF